MIKIESELVPISSDVRGMFSSSLNLVFSSDFIEQSFLFRHFFEPHILLLDLLLSVSDVRLSLPSYFVDLYFLDLPSSDNGALYSSLGFAY